MLRSSMVDFRWVNLMPLPFSAAFSFINHRCDVCVFNLQLNLEAHQDTEKLNQSSWHDKC